MAMGKMYKSRKGTYKTGIQKVARKLRAVNDNFKKRVRRAAGVFRDKRYDVFSTISSYSDAGNIVSMFSINEGDQVYGERQGNKITPTALKMKYSWQAGDSNNIVRLIVFQWKDDDNTNPPGVLNEIVDISTQGTQNFPNTQVFFAGHKNYHIVYDSGVIALNSSSSNECIVRNVNIYGKRLQGMSYSTGTRGWNQFYFLAMSDSSAVTHPQLRLQAQLEYDA